MWYQDTAGLALDLCLLENQAELEAGVCLILPPAQDPVAGINLPFVFPGNFPDEAFWWNATAVMDMPGGGRAILVLALEAAFGIGPPTIGGQISFARVRIRIDTPATGDYTVTHPYGVEVFQNVPAGTRGINYTADIGIGAPGDFTGALQGPVGPFLVASDAPGGAPLPPVSIPGSANLSLSEAAVPVFVTGSPFGTNYFEICGPGLGTPCVRLDQFTLMGKIHTEPIGSPMTVNRASYSRDGTSVRVDVFATASPGPGAPTPVLSVGGAGSGAAAIPNVLMNGPALPLGSYFGQSIPFATDTLPAEVIVTNLADIPPSSQTAKLVDIVTVTEAVYDPATSLLSITATSSDKLVPPVLTAIGLPGSISGGDILTEPGTPGDPASKRLLNYQLGIPATSPAGPVPPPTVTVRSSAGGVHTAAVMTVAGGVFTAGGPIAVDDFVCAEAGSAPQFVIAVLDNDGPSAAIDATTVQIVTAPSQGLAAVDPGTGVITFTPGNSAFVGDVTFTYRFSSLAPVLPSNVATVTVTTTAPTAGAAPIAMADGPFEVGVAQALQIPVATLLSNDLPNSGTIDGASFAIVAGSAVGGGASLANETVTFTADNTPGAGSFNYTVANTNGQVSAAATVSVTKLDAGEVLVVNRAVFRRGTWRIEGTSTRPGSVVTLHLGNATGPVIGQATADAVGAWRVRGTSTVTPVGNATVTAVSISGATASAAVNIQP